MKILMLRPSYYPEISGGTHLAMDLVEDLLKCGNTIDLVVPSPIRVDKEIKEYYQKQKIERHSNLTIYRVKSIFGEKNLLTRAMRMFNISLKMFFKVLFSKDTDIIFSHSMPVFLGVLAAIGGKIRKIPVIYWEQDIVSESLISTGISKGFKGRLLYKISLFLEKITSKYSTHIITISNQFKERQIIKLNKPETVVDVVYNWIDIKQVYPIPRKDNFLFDKFNLDRDLFYVTYCGNLGLPQNVEILIDAAKQLQHLKKLHILIFGNGVRKNLIENYIKDSQLTNISLLPLQPLEDAAYVYSVGDVGMVIGRKGSAKNGFPSKTWSILAAGQAIISCFDEESELAHFIKDGKCGVALPPDTTINLALTIELLYKDISLVKEYGKNSREYVANNFSREISTKRIIDIVQMVYNNSINY